MKVLLVSIAFPPKRDPESLQVAKYCKYLNRIPEVELEVVTSANPTLHMQTDESLEGYAIGIKVVKEISILENKYLNFLIRKISPGLLHYPDSKFSFWRKYRSVLKTVHTPDILYSRSYPVSSTLLALQLKKKWNVPWVLHLSDPWAVASTSSLSPATYLSGKEREWNKKKEAECFELADKICLTSHKTIQLYKNEYPVYANKFEYIPNVYDDDLAKSNPYKKNATLTFVYTGGFGEARKPNSILEAIKIFWDTHKNEIEGRVQFLFTGEMTRANKSVFDSYSNIPIIKHLGVLPYHEVIALQNKAEVLINVDSDIADPEHAVFFPSKLLEYIIAQRRILAITNPYSTTYDVVQDKLGDCFTFDNVGGIANYFFKTFQLHQSSDESYFYKSLVNGEFSAKHNASRLFELLTSLKIS